MNVAERAREGYGRNSVLIRSPRATEYEALARISHRLRYAAQDRTSNFPAYVAALSENARLWTTFAADVADPANPLPQELRARIFWLAEFTDAETRKLMRGNGDVAILIEINAAILHGLRGAQDAAS